MITTSMSKRAYLASDNSRDPITSIEAVSAGAVATEQMLILSGNVQLERFFRDPSGDVLTGPSESGYSNDGLAYESSSL